MNKLDLVKVGKSFGFPVPPRVNLKVGGGQGGQGRIGKKRQRDEDGENDKEEEWEEIDAVDKVDDDGEEGTQEGRSSSRIPSRNSGWDRRREMLGQKKFEKDKFKKGMDRKRAKTSGGPQWNR